MDATILATHSDDTSRLKSQIAIYDGSGSWIHFGINHPILAHFLCPVRELKRFSEDANKALKDIWCGNVNLTAFALPAFLWSSDPPGRDYDDDNMFEGMFDGYLLELCDTFLQAPQVHMGGRHVQHAHAMLLYTYDHGGSSPYRLWLLTGSFQYQR
ncbi:hypothetical protein BDR07DRAFT_1480949 [Suillus spraguei]|nr:hypothetical protein BDR07DRAFT_1480949 [Suillus spraguei]